MTLREILICLAGALVLVSGGPAGAQPGRPTVRALLVGVSDYPDAFSEIVSTPDLVGAGNDVYLMARVLQSRGASPEHLAILTDAPARHGFRPRGRPTLAAIRQAFASLASVIRRGDQVVVLLSGHGYQQPERIAGNELDRLDEVYLPLDASFRRGPDGYAERTGSGLVRFEGALVDDEIRVLIQALRDRGANVFLIADFCHSGDSTRGGTPAADATAERSTLGDLPPAVGNYVAFFATPSSAIARQGQVPAWADNSEPHGVLTGYTAMALSDPRVVTYRDLAVRVQAFVREHNGYTSYSERAPPPQFEGPLNRRVLGGLASGDGRVWRVDKEASETEIASIRSLALPAGGLDGIDEGAILSLGIRRGARVETVLYGRAVRVGPTSSTLEPAEGPGRGKRTITATAWNDLRDENEAPLTGETAFLARLVQRGAPPLYRVAIPGPSEAQTPLQRAAVAALSAIQWEPLRIARVPLPEAQLRILFEGDTLVFASDGAPDGIGFGRFELAAFAAQSGSDFEERLEYALAAAVEAAATFERRRTMMLRLIEAGSEETAIFSPGGLDVSLHEWAAVADEQVGECPQPAGWSFGDPLPAGSRALTDASLDPPRLRRCDVVFIEVANRGERALDLTVLVFAADGSIEALPAQPNARVRIEPGQTVRAGHLIDPRIAGGQVAREDLLLIAAEVRADREGGREGIPTNLSYLCQQAVVTLHRAIDGLCEDPGARRDAGRDGLADGLALALLLDADTARDGAASIARTAVRRYAWFAQ